MNKITKGDFTNKGTVIWTTETYTKTTQGICNTSELTLVEKTKKDITELKDFVDFNTVMSVDIRPGKVISAIRVPKTDKLITLNVLTSLGQKTVVTNLGEEYQPEDFINKTFLFILNMPPITMRGIISEAMIMASSTLIFDELNNIWINKTVLLPINISIDSIIL